MTVHGIGACMLLSLMRQDRRADLDTSWLLHGPESDEPPAEVEVPPGWRYAAE